MLDVPLLLKFPFLRRLCLSSVLVVVVCGPQCLDNSKFVQVVKSDFHSVMEVLTHVKTCQDMYSTVTLNRSITISPFRRSPDVQLKRLMARNNLTEEEVVSTCSQVESMT